MIFFSSDIGDSFCIIIEMDSEDDDVYTYLGKHVYKSSTIYIKRGDYAPLLKRINESLLKAKVN